MSASGGQRLEAIVRQLVALREKTASERHEEILRGIALKDSDPKNAAYHTGVADGKNGIVKELGIIISMYS